MKHPTADYMEKRYEAVTETGCWLWTGYIGGGGYGRVSIGHNKSLAAHRVMWEMRNGEIPAGMVMCHKCDTPACINPAHLFVGTQGDNVLDAIRKKRYPPKTSKDLCHAGHPYETSGIKRKRCRQCAKDQRNRSYHKKVNRLREADQPIKEAERMNEPTREALRALEKKPMDALARVESIKRHLSSVGAHDDYIEHCDAISAAIISARQEVAPVADHLLPIPHVCPACHSVSYEGATVTIESNQEK